MSVKRTLTALAIALAALALAAPVASARPYVESPTTPAEAASQPIVYEAPEPVAADPGFDWGDAGIGALAVVAIAAIGAGGMLLLGHRRTAADGSLAA